MVENWTSFSHGMEFVRTTLYPLSLCVMHRSIKSTDNVAVSENAWKGIRSSKSGPSMPSLCFVDNLLLFGVAIETQAHVMEGILLTFCRQSGQMVNMSKSQLFVSYNISEEMGNNLSENFGIPKTLDLGVYLGMPLLHKRVGDGTYHFLVEKVRKKFSN